MAELKPSGYLEGVLFKEQSSTADQLFEKKSDQLFETVNNNSFVEICIQEFSRTEHKYGLKYDPNRRLLMSRELFVTVMATFNIFPRFKDFVVFFGFKQTESGLGPPQMRFRAITSDDHVVESRKNVGFECAYELRYVEPNVHYMKKPWRLRQTAVYHRYRLDNRSYSWVVVSASSDTESSIDRYIKSEGDLTAPCPFELHLLIVENALSNWRPYIAHLTEDISEKVGGSFVRMLQ